MRRQIHWVFVLAALISLLIESLAWAGAVALPQIGTSIRRSLSHEAPVASAYVAIGEALRTIEPLRDYGDAFAVEALSPLHDRIVATPPLAGEYIFGEPVNAKHRHLQWLYYAPWLLLTIAALLFITRPPIVHLVPKRR